MEPGKADYHQQQQQYGSAPPGYSTSQAVVMTTPVSQEIQRTVWSSNLCGCCEDVTSCLCAYFCMPCFLNNLATRFGASCLYGYCCVHHFLTIARPYIRAKHNIEGDLCDDCCTTVCCTHCVITQISRELDHRGYPKGCCF